jgi:hypothetical protein
MFVLQHCTDSLHVMAGLFCDTCALFSDGMYEEKHTDVKEEEELSVKTEKDICIEEEECIDMKDVVGMYNEEKEEEDIDTQKEEDIGIKEESCTDSLRVLPSSFSETFPTSSDGTYDVGNIKVEEDIEVIEERFTAINKESDIGIKQEEIPEDITFPDIKSEPDEAASNERFTQQGTVKRLQVLHTGEHPYRCDVCDKTPGSKWKLKVHQRVHSGERPYCCELCNKTFKQMEHMKVHQRVHTGERPYSCEVCSKAFSHKCVLKRHLSYCNQQS